MVDNGISWDVFRLHETFWDAPRAILDRSATSPEKGPTWL